MTLDKYIDWAVVHPVAALIETVLILSLILKMPTLLALIPHAIDELREKRAAERRRLDEETRVKYKGPWA